jgi:uncharacterized flavoprotein (TIGR03862 family)
MARVAIIGAGPAGLYAAEHLAARGHVVMVFDRMGAPGRKFLMAGRGGLNLTHSEAREAFLPRYGEAALWLAPMIDAFSPQDLRYWAEGLGQPCFIGTSGRVFPTSLKAAPLLRAWLERLAAGGVSFWGKHVWTGFDASGSPVFEAAGQVRMVEVEAVLLALGGASWPKLGSDGGWVPILRAHDVNVADLAGANCGVRIAWPQHFFDRFAGEPLKRIRLYAGGQSWMGDAVVTRFGLEGGAIYPLASILRTELARGPAQLIADLRPDLSEAEVSRRLRARSGVSVSNQLRRAGLGQAAAAIVQMARRDDQTGSPLEQVIKAAKLPILGLAPIDRAISTSGGIQRGALTDGLMLKSIDGVFAAGEMLDWDAPTGGYLLQACFSSGAWAAAGIDAWLKSRAQCSSA